MMLTSPMDASSLRSWVTKHNLGTSRCRREGASTPSDLFRASTSCGIAVRAGGGQDGGGRWMPGTSPGMTTKGGAPEAAHAVRHCPRCRSEPGPWRREASGDGLGYRHRARPVAKPDSSGTSPDMTEEMSRTAHPSTYLGKPPYFAPPRHETVPPQGPHSGVSGEFLPLPDARSRVGHWIARRRFLADVSARG